MAIQWLWVWTKSNWDIIPTVTKLPHANKKDADRVYMELFLPVPKRRRLSSVVVGDSELWYL